MNSWWAWVSNGEDQGQPGVVGAVTQGKVFSVAIVLIPAQGRSSPSGAGPEVTQALSGAGSVAAGG